MATSSKKVHVAEVVRHEGPGIQVPQNLPLDAAIAVLQRKLQEEEQVVDLHATLDSHPYDAAWAAWSAAQDVFGYAVQAEIEKDMGFFSMKTKRNLIDVVVDAEGHTVQVPWGAFEVPGVEGYFETSWKRKDDGRIVGQLSATVKGKYREAFRRVVERARQRLREGSLYKGKALDIKFIDEDGNASPVPPVRFVDVAHAVQPIFPEAVAEALEHDVMAYVRYPERIRALRGTVKRGILLAGPYGTGKTLTAAYVAREATRQGYTFVYCKAQEIPYAVDFARQYQPAVIFAEDLETVAHGERDDVVNTLLNKVDGVDGKQDNLLLICTTNHPEKINRAMIRPGRLDVILPILPPDAAAALRIARHYAQDQFADDNFEESGAALDGMIPAVIQEAVARAQIRALARTDGGDATITNRDLVAAARAVQAERDLFTEEAKRDPVAVFADHLGRRLAEPVWESIGHVAKDTMERVVTAGNSH